MYHLGQSFCVQVHVSCDALSCNGIHVSCVGCSFYLLVCPVNLPGVQEASNTSFGLFERVRDMGIDIFLL